MRRGLGPGHYAVLAAGLTATAWLVARAGGLPGKWLPPTALAVLLLGLTYRLLLPYLQREAVAGRIARRELAARRDELQALRATLRAAHLAYRAEALRAAAEQLRGEE
ncbi:MAG: hypothetical protein HUU35_18310, partial [Armatimonadetes bacterium]|nr:hypothetical protein [Armatimonadota bacterium]